jgi:hypothetical protein
MPRGGARPGAGRKRKTLLMLVNDGTFNASKANHRERLRTCDSLMRQAESDPDLVELVQVQLAYREAATPGRSNPWYAQALAHRFGRLVGERADRSQLPEVERVYQGSRYVLGAVILI